MREKARERKSEQEPKGQQQVGENGEESRQIGAVGWQVVHRKKTEQAKKEMDVGRNYNGFEKEAVRTSFFFTNFPEHYLAKHMLKLFLQYGEFEEVVIPPKRDKRGCRFGFVRAINVGDPEKLAVVLDNIFIGKDKIMVNLPRFNRNEGNGSRAVSSRKPLLVHGERKAIASVIVNPKVAGFGEKTALEFEKKKNPSIYYC